ncbi:MAG: AraC family transcriptional regulator [Gemmatimonadaceae bacterium]
MSITWASGRFVSWIGGCLFVGESVALIPEHAHYAIQIAFGEQHGIRFETNGAWKQYGGAIIPSRQPHAMDATGVGMSAVLMIEPETPQGRMLAQRFLQNGIAAIPEEILTNHAPSIFEACGALDWTAALQDVCQSLLRALIVDVGPALVVDERISRAISFINANLDASLTLESVAREACLSPSRFRHVFVEATGMAFRPYVLWRRFVRAWELLSAGATLSTAAHAAGFADAAHLTRTSRSTFGFPPSALHIVRPRSPSSAPMANSTSKLSVAPRFKVQRVYRVPPRMSRV